MKIAILGSFDFHLECIGFILEIYNNNNDNIDIYINKDSDKYNFIKYFLKIFNFKIVYDSFSIDIIEKYDKVFKLTSNDYCLDHPKIISILHLNGKEQKNTKSEKFISLTPYIQGNNIYYTFPIFTPHKLLNSINNKIVTMIGYYKTECFDQDTINFFKINYNYNFNLLISNLNYDECPQLYSLKNVRLYSNISTERMLEFVNESKYILSKKYINYDRFSGQLNIAMSFEKPLIIDMKTKKNYNLPGISFKEYSDVGKLDDISDEKYNNMKNDIINFNKKALEKNREIFNLL